MIQHCLRGINFSNCTFLIISVFFYSQGHVAFSSFVLSEFLRSVPLEQRPIQAVVGPASSAVTEMLAYIFGGKLQLHQVRKKCTHQYSLVPNNVTGFSGIPLSLSLSLSLPPSLSPSLPPSLPISIQHSICDVSVQSKPSLGIHYICRYPTEPQIHHY